MVVRAGTLTQAVRGGISVRALPKTGLHVTVSPLSGRLRALHESQVLPAPAIQEPHEQDSLKTRIEASIATEEAVQERLLAEAQTDERCRGSISAGARPARSCHGAGGAGRSSPRPRCARTSRAVRSGRRICARIRPPILKKAAAGTGKRVDHGGEPRLGGLADLARNEAALLLHRD